MNSMKIYIGGKITDNPNYKAEFEIGVIAVKNKIRSIYGRELPIITMIPKNEPQGLTKELYMMLSFARINEADIVAFLPNWEDSEGALLEEGYATYISKTVMLISEQEMEATRREVWGDVMDPNQ